MILDLYPVLVLSRDAKLRHSKAGGRSTRRTRTKQAASPTSNAALFSKNRDTMTRITRRELIQLSATAPLLEAQSGRLDRRAVVRRHNPVVTKFDAGSSLSVGNGSFAFTVDCTGLQSVPDLYLDGVPLATQAEWAWYTMANPAGYRYEDTFAEFTTHNGRRVKYPSKWEKPEERFFRETPYKLGLGQIGFITKDSAFRREDCDQIHQELNLWKGAIRSRFRWKGKRVDTTTASHPRRDAIAVRIQSQALRDASLRVRFAFPFTSCIYPWAESPFSPGNKGWADAKARGEKWSVTVDSQDSRSVVIRHMADANVYFATLRFSPGASLARPDDETFVISSTRPTLEFTVEFTPDRPAAEPLEFDATVREAAGYWDSFWSGGACLDFAHCNYPGGRELERRAVLSQYLMAIQCAGRLPGTRTRPSISDIVPSTKPRSSRKQ